MQNTIMLRDGSRTAEASVSFNVPTDETRAYETDGWHATIGNETVTRGHETREACVAALRAEWASK